ncbi:hypothetical protein OF83DRAFT_1055406 [Amylostereum chailletii]|nr:hypothetical protein OF83DRAFT_1055406 [Amylostereum chailletii]
MKMHRYLRAWGGQVGRNPTFVYRTIQQVIRYTYATIRGRDNGPRQVARNAVFWLGSKAFHTVLSRKLTAYRPILVMLIDELGLRKYREHKREFRKLVGEGATLLSLLCF